ncbi:SDR family NAD(P)-dependent oxidoreductase [Streptomyces varsoviensis]|uniref:Short-chain dehydrogenase n=1 Tax=Streptomyces varsoviensis TaxID=67373 RepID=A0ABR5JA09_9ACTN|nr:SDR family NAD(P)-dependent oxidoreductase [Streptomyces varsoviensis]KOG90215.1 short-chain dehydrogenase [Streptomyces varsoviensis]
MTASQVAVVTGTSSGIGLHTALGLAHKGLRVVATMRDTGRAGALRDEAARQGVELAVRALDVTDRDGACACLDDVAAEFGAVDILVNNAGSATFGTLEQLSDAALQKQLDVNFLGVAALTRHVLPSMRKSGAGRIITVTSNGGVVGEPFLDAYCASKFAVEGLMQSLAPVAARFGVTVSVVEPASVVTDMMKNLDTEALAAPNDPYRDLAETFYQTAGTVMAGGQTAQDAAAVVVEAATTDTPRFRWQTSQAAVDFVGLSLADLDGSKVLGAMSAWLD